MDKMRALRSAAFALGAVTIMATLNSFYKEYQERRQQVVVDAEIAADCVTAKFGGEIQVDDLILNTEAAPLMVSAVIYPGDANRPAGVVYLRYALNGYGRAFTWQQLCDYDILVGRVKRTEHDYAGLLLAWANVPSTGS